MIALLKLQTLVTAWNAESSLARWVEHEQMSSLDLSCGSISRAFEQIAGRELASDPCPQPYKGMRETSYSLKVVNHPSEHCNKVITHY